MISTQENAALSPTALIKNHCQFCFNLLIIFMYMIFNDSVPYFYFLPFSLSHLHSSHLKSHTFFVSPLGGRCRAREAEGVIHIGELRPGSLSQPASSAS